MNKFSNLNLRKNPFENVTPSLEDREHGKLIWSGMPKLKKILENVHAKSFSSSAHKIILNWGAWGAGKTFAAYYFNEDYIQKRFQKTKEDILHIYIRLPKNGNDAIKQLFKDILDYISLSKIKMRIQSNISELNENIFYDHLNRKMRSEEFSKAILKLADTDNEISEMMARYLYVGSTKTELKKLGLSRSLTSDIDFMKILTGILYCFVSLPPSTETGRIFIWIDEMEDLIYYNSKQYRVFSQILRDLFDQLSEGLTVFMNFTLAEPEEGTVKLLVGEALWSRIIHKVRFSELSREDAMLYCKEQIQSYQIAYENEYSPFTEKSLRTLIDMIPAAEMTPREINKVCDEVLNFALNLNISDISEKVIQKWVNEKSNSRIETANI